MAQILAQSYSWIRRYESAAQTHPLPTKAATCLVGFALGDVVAQSLSRPVKIPITTDGITLRKDSWSDNLELDFARCLRMALFGALVAAPQMHFFLGWLDKVVMPRNPTHPAAVLSKVAVDQIVNSPLGTMTFFAWTQFLQGTPGRIGDEISEKLWFVTKTGWSMWPAAQALNFLFVPLQFRVIYLNAVSIVWTCILSKVGNSNNDA